AREPRARRGAGRPGREGSDPARSGRAPLRRDRRGREGHDVSGAGAEPLGAFALTAHWSPATDSNGPLPVTGRVRRRLRLQGRARRSSHQTTADLQTCDARSAGARFIRRQPDKPAQPGYQAGALISRMPTRGRVSVAGVGIEPTWFQAYEAWQGPALPARLGGAPRPTRTVLPRIRAGCVAVYACR